MFRLYAEPFTRRDKVIHTIHRSKCQCAGQPEGSIMTVEFQLNGQDFVGLNGGPLFKFNEAVSFVLNCQTGAGRNSPPASKAVQCGWLKDKYGVSWHVFPMMIRELFGPQNPARSRVMAAIIKMKKPDIKKLKQAAKEKQAMMTWPIPTVRTIRPNYLLTLAT